MFENKLSKNEKVHYSRYIASWVKVAFGHGYLWPTRTAGTSKTILKVFRRVLTRALFLRKFIIAFYDTQQPAPKGM